MLFAFFEGAVMRCNLALKLVLLQRPCCSFSVGPGRGDVFRRADLRCWDYISAADPRI